MSNHFILSATFSQPEMNDPQWAGPILAQAEAAGLDLAIIGAPDALPFDAMVIAAWAAPMTRTLGIVPCISTHVAHPFHAARSLSAIDFLSSGRAAWNPVTGSEHDSTVTTDMVGAARSLWDGWDADALIIDKQSGRYLDGSKVRLSQYAGPHFKVRGPLNAARPPQGHPVLVEDRRSPFTADGVDLAIVDDATATAAATKQLLRVGAAPDVEPLAARFAAGAIGGVHWDIADAQRDIAAISDFAQRVAPHRRAVEAGADLRQHLGLPLSSTLVSRGERA